jgi:hypothetical protein
LYVAVRKFTHVALNDFAVKVFAVRSLEAGAEIFADVH